MMGFALFDLDVPTTKTASALTCLTKDEVAALEPSACINCARCVEVCPERLVPKNLADAVEHNNEKAFLDMYGMECCECGCCSYICPARRPLVQTNKLSKILLKNFQAERKKEEDRLKARAANKLKAIVRIWRLYRHRENMGFLKSLCHLVAWAFMAVARRL